MSGDLFNSAGKRLYLTLEERKKFLAAADKEDRETRTFCYALAYSGCRISEALALTPEAIDLGAGTIVFETLEEAPQRGVSGGAGAPYPARHDRARARAAREAR